MSDIHIAISPGDLSDEYNRHAGATIASVLVNCKKQVTVHVLYDKLYSLSKNKEITEQNMFKYQMLCDKYGALLQFHDIQTPEWMWALSGSKIFTPWALLRVYLPSLLSDVDTVLYLDCDVLCNLDVSEMFAIDMGKYGIAARQESSYDILWSRQYKKMNVSSDSYFNSGVLLMNLETLRENHDLINDSKIFFGEYPASPYPDQDFLNQLFQNNFYHLDNKYNLFPEDLSAENSNDTYMVHYAKAINKPWNSYHGDVDEIYWNNLLLTPWGDDRKNLIKYARASENREKFIEGIPKWIYRYPFRLQLKLLYKLSLGLWIDLILTYGKEIIRRL